MESSLQLTTHQLLEMTSTARGTAGLAGWIQQNVDAGSGGANGQVSSVDTQAQLELMEHKHLLNLN